MKLRSLAFGAALLASSLLSVAPAAAQGTPPTAEEPARFGRIAVTVVQNGGASSGSFTVYRPADPSGAPGAQVASGHSGNSVSVPVGTYDVVVRLDGAIDRPETWKRGVRVGAGQQATVRQEFSTSVLEVRVTAAGRRAAGTIVVRRAGESTDLATLGSGVRAVLSIGTYDVLVRHRTQERWFRGVVLAAGAGRVLSAEF